jgi:hypothetical protein
MEAAKGWAEGGFISVEVAAVVVEKKQHIRVS